MVLKMSGRDLRALRFLGGAPLVGIGIMVMGNLFASAGHIDRLFNGNLVAALLCSLIPFLIVGLIASAASRRRHGNLIGSWTLLGGTASVGVLFFEGFREAQQALDNHAWTAAALAPSMMLCLSFPASVVGSLIGLWIGVAVSKLPPEPSPDPETEMKAIADEPGAAP